MASAVAGIGRAICVGMVVTQRHLDVVKGVGKLPSRSIAAVSVTSEVIKCKVELLQSILLIVTCSQRRSMASVSALRVQLGKHLLTINRKSHKARFGSFIIVHSDGGQAADRGDSGGVKWGEMTEKHKEA